ncbi:MAG: ACT domain-containing protein [Actinomycetes bacterium]
MRGADFGAALSDAVDAAIRDAYAPVARGDLVVLALGSFARRELCPASDVDVLLLHREPTVAAVADALWYPLWDAGLVLGHAARTPREALRLAEQDLDTLTSLLDVRVVCGEAVDDARTLVHRTRRLARRRRDALIAELAAAAARRRERPGPVAEVLEPDLKEGSGGLRDLHALGWAGWALGPGGPAALVGAGALRSGDLEVLAAANAALLDVRVALHRTTGRAGDRLALQDQDAVAPLVGAPDADALVQHLAGRARAVSWIATEAWSALGDPPRGRTARRSRDAVPVGDGLLVRQGTVSLAERTPVDRSTVLRVAAAAAGHGGRIARATLERLRDAPAPGWDEDDRRAFTGWWRAGHPAIAVAEAFDHLGILGTVIPEWRTVRSRPQRNAYHRFTVDRHLLETAAEAAALLDAPPGSPDAEVVADLDRPDLLLLAALLHDIGKGQGGDHAEVGARLAGTCVARMGFAGPDVARVEWLVRHHLLMADTATRRDLADPTTIERFTARAADPASVVLLHALTVADSRATGPAAWSAAKASLVAELRDRALAALARDRMPQAAGDLLEDHEAALRAGSDRVEWSTTSDGDLRCTVVARDRPGLLASVATALALAGLDVRSVDAASDDAGMAVEVFTGTDRFGRLGDAGGRDRAARGVEAAIAGAGDLRAQLAERAAAYRRGGRIDGPVSVTVDLLASTTATVIEVHADDAVGRFAELASILADGGYDVRTARATTIGDRIVDVFYVCDASGRIVDPAAIARLRATVLGGLGGGAGPA